MQHLRQKTSIFLSIALIALVSLCSPALRAQNFRGAINGTVTDHIGATLPNAAIVVLNVDTGVSRSTVSSSAGEFSFQDLPLGTYTVTVTDAGFAVGKYEKISLSAGTAYTLPVVLSVSSAAQTVDVVAGALALDTTSAILTTNIPSQVVNDAPSNGRDFTQFIQYTPGFAGYSVGGGAGAAQVNGVRTNQVNWQIEGTDNNDLWWNIPAVNQGGVSGIAGIVIPLDSIEEFSFVTSGMPETGRNAGGTVNLSIKSGTNVIHGDAYYYNRNEKFAAESPFAPPGTEKSKTRDIDYGGSVGGPIIKDKLFYFVSYEHQNFVIGVAQAKTEPSAAYQAAATNVLGAWGIPVNPVSTALLANLWPQSALTGGASSGNYFNPGTENGHSFNPLVKLDWNIDPKNSISVKGYFGDGNQTAPTSSELSPYFEVAPIHVENYSVIYNHIFSSKLANQAFFGVSYFDQVFSDADHTFDPVALGLNTGVTDPGLLGSPKITIGGAAAGSGLTGSASGFDPIGVTPPEGRQDITGHFDDAVAYTIGKHEIRFGGEFRKAQVYDFYQTGARGVFTFDGSQGPWSTSGGSAACNALSTTNGTAYDAGVTDGNVFLLADFLAGCIGTGSATIAEGNQKRTVYENTWDIFAQDAWQITSKLNLNYGVRYDYAQSVHDSDKDLTSFDPTQTGGFAIQGGNVSDLYHPYKGSISPRVGVSYSLDDKTTLRLGGGMFFDSIYMLSLLNLRGTTDGGALGIGNNLAGANPVVTAQATPTNEGGGAVITAGQPIFPTLAAAQAGAGVTNAYSINPNYRPSYTYSYNLNMQHQLSSKVILQLGYLGTLSRKLTEVLDINPEATSNLAPGVPPEDQQTRPYYNQFPNIGNVNQLNSNLNANYNSLQTSLRSTGWHGITSQIVYTWSHALDYETGLIPYLPQDSRNVKAEYGNSDYDTRNTFSALATYALPSLSSHKRLTGGWELNTALSFHGGQPFSVVTGSDESGNGDYAERMNVTGISPFKGVSHAITYPLNASGQPGPGQVNWFNPAAFSEPTAGTFGDERRNQYFSPGFADVDFSVVKTTKLGEHVSLQLRAEMFNLTNRVNLSPLGFPQTTGPTITSTIGAAFGAPGIGPGEPFNTQFVGKVIF
jgi:hypothetical protein